MLWSILTSRRTHNRHVQEIFLAGRTLTSSTGGQHAATNKLCHQHLREAQLAEVRTVSGLEADPKVTVHRGIITTVVHKVIEVSIELHQVRTTPEDRLDALPGRMIGRKQHTRAEPCLHIKRLEGLEQVLTRTFRATTKNDVMIDGQGSERNRLEGMTGDLEMIVEMDTATATATAIENTLIQIDRVQHQATATAAGNGGHAVAVAVRREKTIRVITGLAIVRKETTTGDEELTEHI